MKHKIKKQFVLCFLTESNVMVDARNSAHGIDISRRETFTMETFGTFNSRFEALKELESKMMGSDQKFTILETLQIVRENK
tara:strand:- start:226 stop:468 length:243 start_codon:yes stop_codon:yes gene_type:complete